MLGSLVGVVTNAADAAVSTDYYCAVLTMPDDGGAVATILLHGIVEGGVLGLLFGVTLGVAAAASTRLRLPLRSATLSLGLAVAVTLVCWTAGGVVGFGWAAADPRSFQGSFPPSAGFTGSDLRFAWVGGTIWGAYAGTLCATVVGRVHLHFRWRACMVRAGQGRQFEVAIDSPLYGSNGEA